MCAGPRIFTDDFSHKPRNSREFREVIRIFPLFAVSRDDVRCTLLSFAYLRLRF